MDIIGILGKSCLERPTEESRAALDYCANNCCKYGMYFGLLIAVSYGKILGKREERARRKAGAAK